MGDGTERPAGDQGRQQPAGRFAGVPAAALPERRHGGFRPAPDGALPPLPISVGAVAAADFDHEGRLGLFIGGRVLPGQYPLAPRSALLANRGGRFEDVTDALAPGLREVGMVTSALWSDVDGDGWPDLLLTLEWGSVKYFHNKQGRGFEDWTERAGFAAAGTGWWTSIAAADFNGDGRPDYVVGNVGLNTQYHADSGASGAAVLRRLQGRRLSRSSSRRTTRATGSIPGAAGRDLGAAIPSVLKRYPRNDAYARATLGEILGEDRLAAAAALRRHGAPQRRVPEPARRHLSIRAAAPPGADLAPAGHRRGGFRRRRPRRHLCRAELLRADSVGRPLRRRAQPVAARRRPRPFHAGARAESGLVVPGDAKALAVLDLDQDGWPDFLVSRNNDTTLAFRNGRVPAASLRVRLRGPAGNPTGVGARITVELADGSTQTGEVCAGSGYYSQSTASCFFGYPDANPPKKIRVRWPTGTTSESEVPSGVAELTLSPQAP